MFDSMGRSQELLQDARACIGDAIEIARENNAPILLEGMRDIRDSITELLQCFQDVQIDTSFDEYREALSGKEIETCRQALLRRMPRA